MLPRCEMFKEVIFTPRIICFNESFVPLGKQTKSKTPVAIIWNEGVAGRSKVDIMSTFYAFFLQKRDASEMTIWLDNCASQNKNWSLYGFFVYIVNSDEVSLESLEIKYFEPGHTFMSADSFHHQVEQSLKRKGKVLDFADFVECVETSNSSRVQVVNMRVNDFYDYEDFSSKYKLGRLSPRVYLSDVVQASFTKGSTHLGYKTSFAGNQM